jgi:pimeloyl-ACP methyl ester carboxylesterase
MMQTTRGMRREDSLYPLARFAGDVPPRPDWFERALAVPCETLPLRHDGADIELLCWGERGKPGLLLLHGNRSHARWWSPVAGLLADRFRIAAPSLSGLGGSGWRDAYSVTAYGEEVMAAARAAGLFEGGAPVLAGHSFGSGPVIAAAAEYWRELAGLIVLDTHLTHLSVKPDIGQAHVHKVYPDVASALARFRLAPAQECENLFYLDWIARNALREVPVDAPGGPGWSWCFDPRQWDVLEWYERWDALPGIGCPVAFINGELSIAMDAGQMAAVVAHLGGDVQVEVIAQAHHHLMLDQPRAVAGALARLAGGMVARRPRSAPM